MRISVFCASGMGNDPRYIDEAALLGRLIGEHGHELVYGGGDSGLMGILAAAARGAGAEVTGVLPGNIPFICDRPQPYCTQVVRAADMNERKRELMLRADAFIALPGGTGTLDEISEAITLTRVGVFDKPAVLISTGGFYEPLRQLILGMESAGFARPDDRLRFVSDAEEALRFLEERA